MSPSNVPPPPGTGFKSLVRASRVRPLTVAGVTAILVGVGALAGVQPAATASPDGTMGHEQVTIPPGNGFGGGTLHYPANASGKLPAVVISPAFGAGKGFYEWNAAKLATHGFVALNTDTIDLGDSPMARRDQMLAALDYLVNDSSLKDRIDGSRLAVEGHSASAAGVLMAGLERPSLKAVIALAPVGPQDLSGMKVPTLLVCGETDGLASPDHCNELAGGVPAGTPKRPVAVPGGGHGFPTGDNDVAFPAELAWLKQHLGGGSQSDPQSSPQSDPQSSPQSDPQSSPQSDPQSPTG